ncbi:acylamino-acid-releasing enzyme [Penicillium bovifimosum]|uniref:Acylamino-acid-releasing enzyme n=1 Tax=Penicillium bovifimosum TaxID=126998 RepID=A0A9W9H9X3_9EURO|nr:acylamino-acid-releasing enzyme [Penicillium bovifimosum]KAJ5142618.1 acylamino-acid-releasing enzyme [Penicillium bovifimosum]
MAIHSTLTPEALLEAPIYSHPIPNASGNLAVYTQRKYSFRSHSEIREIRVWDMNSPRSWAVTDNPRANYPGWLGHSEQLIWLEAMDNGNTRFVVRDSRLRSAHYVVGTVPGPVKNLKVTSVAFSEDCDDDLSFAVVGQANTDGTLFNPDDNISTHTPHHPQTTLPGRGAHRPKSVIWFGGLVRPSQATEGQYTMTPMTNLMEYFKFGELESDGSFDDDSLDFFKDTWHILFVAKDPESDQSTHTASSCYLCPMMAWTGFPPPDECYHAWRFRGLGGTISSPTVNAGGTVALLCKKEDGYAADKNRIVEQEGRQVLYQLNLASWPNPPTPADLELFDGLMRFGSVMDVTPLPEKSKRVLVSCDSSDSSRRVIIQDLPAQVSGTSPPSPIRGESFGLSERQVDQIWFPGDEQRQIHAWVVKPSYFKPKQIYPLLYVIHGGPQDSWRQGWDMRCHLALFAEHGGFEYIRETLEYVDTERAVALGLGYGGYMINWIQGNGLGCRFKALIADNGTFNLLSHLSNSTQHSILHGLGGPPWLNPEAWRKWDPAQHAGNWKTPLLLIHGELNRQSPVSDTLAAFNTLKLQSAETALLIFPDEGSRIRSTENLLLWYRTVLEWLEHEQPQNKRIGMFSYGSGLASTLFSFRVKGDTSRIAEQVRLNERLESRTPVSPEFYNEMCDLREKAYQQKNYTPVGSVDTLTPGIYYLVHVDDSPSSI